jgi:AcrR family transcriptional regulator
MKLQIKINMVRNNILEKSILEAAERLFLEKGFALTTTTMIAKEVGCNQSLVHYYYRSKENLFELVFQKALNTFIAGFTDIGDKNLTFEERLKHCVYTQFEMMRANPEIVFFLINEITTNPKRLLVIKEQFKTLSSDILQLIGRKLQIEIKTGNIQPISPIDFMLNIFSLNTSVFLFYYIAKKISLFADEELRTMIEKRKEDNYKLILKSVLKS